ncbi:toxic anion resistance protein [Pseudothauera lacus]|uniref:Toxic anion resistance protein n=1 Tax=Pseudothauera lacus TaxID=2136175 RepID=A0A2T4IER4_9RHOO|nr:toxic anion resistance protein [Pseudothauera lacus]PTD96269.1 toxic anion resistance protein [Pseudothauera lacus]
MNESSTALTLGAAIAEGTDPDQAARQIVTALSEGEHSLQGIRDALNGLGQSLQVKAARKSELLLQPMHQLSARAADGGSIANTLIDLKMQVEALDPARVDFSAGWLSRLFGYLPFVGTPVKRYFSRYESASTVIDAIVASLERGREELKRDNITLRADQEDLRALAGELTRTANNAQLIDARLSEALEIDIPADDPRADLIARDLLFPLRQRIQDIQQQLAVTQQGLLTSDLIVRNNEELIRGVNRALTVTVNALQVVVSLAAALANQRIVLDKVNAVNRTTERMIGDGARMLREQGAEIHRQAASSQLDIGVLRQAFADIRGALDEVSSFRQQALPEMARNILALDEITREAGSLIERLPASHGS